MDARVEKAIARVSRSSKESFEGQRAQLTFEEYLDLVYKRPYTLTRNIYQLLRDLFLHHGASEVPGLGGVAARRFNIFDDPRGDGLATVFGQEEVQNRLFEVISGFAERGRCDRFVLLHGPNGSAKSSIVDCLRNALEGWSRTDDCPLFRFSWVFCERSEKGEVGFGRRTHADEGSLAHVDDRFITSRIPCEMKDPPWLLIPKKRRLEILEEALSTADESERERFVLSDALLRGELSPKNKVLYESLLRSCKGDWQRVLRHVRVERYYISHRYRTGSVTIEPQTTVDAGSRMLAHGSMEGLPAVLMHEDLHEAHGDLVDANHGIAEYSDFLKRPIEANKYLLTTVERGLLHLPAITVALDLLQVGTSDEKYLAAFKRDPTFPGFKGRMELVRVPYLRRVSDEARIYERHLDSVARGVHVAPHCAEMAALFAVLTRMRRPDAASYEGALPKILKKLKPAEKAALYEDGTLPEGLDESEQHALAEGLPFIAAEFDGAEEELEECVEAAYEGRVGASPREMQSLLSEATASRNGPCLTPMDILDTLPRLLADPTLYAFLRIAPDGAYGQSDGFLKDVRDELVQRLGRSLREASQLVDEGEADRVFTDYLREVKAFGTGEQVQDERRHESRAPDAALMESVEKHLDVHADATEFRHTIIRRIGAFRLSQPDEPLVLKDLFAAEYRTLERSFFREREAEVLRMARDALLELQGGNEHLDATRREQARSLGTRLLEEHGWCGECVGAMLSWYLKHQQEQED
jgi:predicted Ser/Thr protein kinase